MHSSCKLLVHEHRWLANVFEIHTQWVQRVFIHAHFALVLLTGTWLNFTDFATPVLSQVHLLWHVNKLVHVGAFEGILVIILRDLVTFQAANLQF